MPIKKYLTEQQARDLAGHVQQAVLLQGQAWGALGWGYVGQPGKLRICIRVETTLVDPDAPVAPITLPGVGLVKPMLAAAYGSGAGSMGTLPAAGHGNGGLVGPGSPVHVDGPEGVSRAGIAALLEVAGEPHLLSCGHVFGASGGGDLVFRPGDPAPVARLRRNFMADDPPLDASICRVLRPDTLAAYSHVLPAQVRPAPGCHGRQAVFWHTHADGLPPVTAPVISYLGCEYSLRNSTWNHVLYGLVTLPGLTQAGDSGSLLALDGRHLGICSGRVGAFSFFTPVDAALERIGGHFGGCSFLSW